MTFAIALFISSLISGCKFLADSRLSVTNPEPAANRFPEVVELVVEDKAGALTRCSGTFVTGNSILTAAHCLFDDNGERVKKIIYRAPDKSLHEARIYPSLAYDPKIGESKSRGQDLAIITFSQENLAPKIADIAPNPPDVGEEITLVGFGQTNALAGTGAGQKMIGYNLIQETDENVTYIMGHALDKPRNSEPGILSIAGPGDSGGAMFDSENRLLGVISSGSVSNRIDGKGNRIGRSAIVSLAHPKSYEQLMKIRDKLCSENP